MANSTDTSGNIHVSTDIPEYGDAMPIAVIGMSFVGPGDATSVENLWSMISEGRESWSEIPKEKWNHEAFYHPDPNRHGTYNVKGGHFFKRDLSRFDAPFFHMTAAEAAALDPQQRLLLECTYEAMENSGITLNQFCGTKTSVFAGAFCTDYTDILWRDPEATPMYQCTNAGNSRANLANRLSYFFDLSGPSVSVDTACSTSLVGLHLGCQSLRTGDAKMSLVAGASVILSHEAWVTMSMMRFLSPDGRCYTFDERANGYARGEGVGCLLLKPLTDALRDGDMIRAVIRGSGSSQDGKTPGITMPNGLAQERLIRDVYNAAGLDPAQTEYVEAHGTGTQAGDPLETGAISRVFGSSRPEGDPIKIGSVKTNVGHLEAASGVAGVIKSILMLENEVFLPNRNFQKANPRIPLKEWNLKVPLSVEPWKGPYPRRASVNSFGYGGAIAHVVLENAKDYLTQHGLSGKTRRVLSKKSSRMVCSHVHQNGNGLSNGHQDLNGHCDEIEVDGVAHVNGHSHKIPNGDVIENDERKVQSRIFLLSCFDETAGKKQCENLGAYLERHLDDADETFLDDLAFTLSEKRTTHIFKAAIPAKSVGDLIEKLKSEMSFGKGSKKPRLGFVFTGQGAQWSGMARELLDSSNVFRNTLRRISRHLLGIGAQFDVIDELMQDSKNSKINLALYSQPLCSAIQIGLVDVLFSWGIKPQSVTGHSSGEIAAAYALGALSVEDAMDVAYFRGVASSNLAKRGLGRGAMAAVGLSRTDVVPIIDNLKHGKAVIACSNSPSSVTVSGDDTAIDELLVVLEEKKVFSRKLVVEVAYHSHHMIPIAREYKEAIAGIKVLPASDDIEFFSSVTGRKSHAADLGPDYWVSNMLSEVRFDESLHKLCVETGATTARKIRRNREAAVDSIIEIGPHSALAGPIKQILRSDERLDKASINYHSTLVRNSDANDSILKLASELYMSGYPIPISSINQYTGDERVLVDIPPYSWNHDNSYWAESRKSKALRNRRFPRTDLLGALERTCSPLEPRWSNYIRLAEIPWVRDHVIQSNIVYPAAGYIVMAIEAASQRAIQRSASGITGYKLREVVIGAALVIPEDLGEVEVAVTLKSYSDSMRSPSDVWDEFIISSVSGEDRWTEHCRGLVCIQTPSKLKNEIDGDMQHSKDRKEYSDMIAGYTTRCQKEVVVPDFYEQIANVGLEYGETFACMKTARSAPNSCMATLAIPNTAAVMPRQFEFPFVIHPATFDSIFHSIFVALAAEVGDLQDPAVPVSLDEIFVSASISNTPGEELMVLAETERKDHRFLSANINVFGAKTINEPVISIRNIVCANLEKEAGQDTSATPQRRAYNLKWEPDVDLLAPTALGEICQVRPTGGQKNVRHNLEICSFYLLKQTFDECLHEADTFSGAYQKDLWSLISTLVETTIDKNKSEPSSNFISAHAAERHSFIEKVKSSGAEGNLLCQLGENLPKLLRGENTPAALLESVDLEPFCAPSDLFLNCQAVIRYVELLRHKNPKLSIMAVGDLCGLTSLPIIAALLSDSHGTPTFTGFDYADPEFDLSPLLKAKVPELCSTVLRKDLDIEKDISVQECNLKSYDVIIAFHMLGSAKPMRSVMSNAQKLLKPSGKLLFVGQTMHSLAAATLFGFLPSILPKMLAPEPADGHVFDQDLELLLAETAFKKDSSTSNLKKKLGTLFLTASPPVTAVEYPDLLVLVEKSNQGGSLGKLLNQFSTLQIKVEVATLSSAIPKPNQVCLVLNELSRHVLIDPSSEEWHALKKVCLNSAGVFWVTRGGTITPNQPENNLIAGFARTIRSETGNLPILTLDLDAEKRLANDEVAEIISSLYRKHFVVGADPQTIEHEYAEKDGILMIPRLVQDEEVNKFISSVSNDMKPEIQSFRQPDRHLHMLVGSPGLLDSLYFADDDRFQTDLPPDWVQMEVKATGLNFKDVMMALGQIKVKKLGWEASGIVTALGKDVSGLNIGDRVLCYGAALFSTDYRGPARQFHKLPDHVSFELGAALPVTYSTAYYSVHHIARLQKGESVLIHAASGGLGQALIELCQLIGAEIYATVGTRDKKRFLMEHFDIPEDHIFFSRDGSFANGVKKMTQGVGVDVIMNSLAGESLRLTWDCIAPYGRFVELGQRDIMINTRLEMGQFNRNATFSAFMLDYLIEQRPLVASKVMADVMDLFKSGSIKGPSPVQVFSISDIEKALRLIQTGGHMGKLVVVNNPGDQVKVLPKDASKHLLKADASYLLIGGLGALGLATASWMIAHGAQNIIFANRSGLKSDEAKACVQALREKGCNIAVYSCDITDAGSVSSMVATAVREMPYIKGVVQGAMVLRDGLFETMSLEDYNSVMRPKVCGTWNLHRSLPKDMDFFIMEASVSGIVGNATQTAYAAGNTFLDAFCRYRNSLGMPATTIDLGAVADVGYLATNTELRDAMQRQGFELTDTKSVLDLIHFSILNPRRSETLSQIVTGLGTYEAGTSLNSLNIPLFSHFRHMSSSERNPASGDSSAELRQQLRSSKTLDDASEVICSSLASKIASRQGVDIGHINLANPISDYGIDSLVAVEIRNWISKEMDCTVPILELLANTPMSALAVKIAQRSRLVQVESASKA